VVIFAALQMSVRIQNRQCRLINCRILPLCDLRSVFSIPAVSPINIVCDVLGIKKEMQNSVSLT